MRLYLAVDGGGSKTDVVIGDEAGRLLAVTQGPSTCHQMIGLPEALRRLRKLVFSALARSGLPDTTVFDRAECYLSGADFPPEVTMLTSAVTSLGWARSIRVANDTYAVLRAGTAAPNAIGVVCGTGINCVARAADGRTTGFWSVGEISGDWGSGWSLGSLALWHAMREHDGRGPSTVLGSAVPAHFGLPDMDAVVAAFHFGQIAGERRQELTPLIFTHAADGDAVCASLVARLAEEIVTLVMVAGRRLSILDSPHTVALGGGVIRPRHPMLLDLIRNGLPATTTMTVVHSPPVLGAALHALDWFGAPPAAHERLHAALAD
ncbi:N-acetylglucosamine kinase [Micromonospora sp. KC721]|uniref:N-acetylglucosamine kinase n=1 Tax=Micromonospora sp. KC721 TaxID=2530380 RepID=UPI00104B7C1F|nr:BadF/BadG/BcrA/BcrD ATPase family protein [Micromonospora sp. KC721]TDB82462.1 ATPase [Micromonospora sp. KC721]